MYIISGMHRSGTSLVARIFFEAGADLGDPNTFYRPDKWNPDGYFEQPEIQTINMALTQGPFWKFAYFRLPSTPTIMHRAKPLSDQIRSTAARYRGKVVKETRYCLTLPAWLEYGAHVDRVLVCLRDPIQVARSLQKRNKITLRHAYGLWLTHNQRLLEHARDIPMRFVYYQNLLDERSCLDEMAAALRFFGINVAGEKLHWLRQTIVKPDLNHHPDSQPAYPAQVESVWRELLRRHACQDENTLHDRVHVHV